MTDKTGYARALAFVEQLFDDGRAEGPPAGLRPVAAERIRAWRAWRHAHAVQGTTAAIAAPACHTAGSISNPGSDPARASACSTHARSRPWMR